MKFSFFVVLAIAFWIQLFLANAVSAQTVSNVKIDLSLHKKSLKEAFLQISKKSGFEFIYNEALVSPFQELDIVAQNKEVAEILFVLLRNTNLEYRQEQEKIIIFQRILWSKKRFVSVTGKLIDELQVPLSGVAVRVKSTGRETITDAHGVFKLDVVNSNDILIFYFPGYQTREITVGDQTTMSVILKLAGTSLNEIVITSFGIRKQERSLGYATSFVSEKEITEAGNTNFASALYGKASGITVKTSPGGSSSAVNIQIRGINSIYYNQQPLFVVDGIIIRNQQEANSRGLNNNGFYDDPRIRGNGILDINPNDIESITILKGASATALYGSDANSGLIQIVTKKGTKTNKPVVDFNYYGTIEQPAFLPNYQNVYGQGYDRDDNLALGFNEDGSISDSKSPAGWRPNFQAYANFGPKMEGQMVRWWDGSVRPYSPQPDNYRDIFRTGFSSSANVAVSNQTDNASYRISASRLDYNGIQRKSDQHKNTFNLNSSLKISSKLNVDIVVNYINTSTANRPYLTTPIVQSYNGFYGREENVNLVMQKYQTSDGYAWVPANQSYINPQEAFVFGVRPNLFDYFFSTLKNSYIENDDRLLTSATLNWSILKHLKLRGRIGNDYTSHGTEEEDYNRYPTVFNSIASSTGAYTLSTGLYSIVYSDFLLTYTNSIHKDFGISLNVGFTSRTENYTDQSSATKDGLATANVFSISNSYSNSTNVINRQELLKLGIFGVANLSYKNYLFLEGTIRQESSSTLPPQNNTYYYPSVNGSFVFTDAFKSIMPQFLNYGKLRLSYGLVGNPAPIYVSNVVYQQSSVQTMDRSVSQLRSLSSYGNSNLKPEKKREYEAGLELHFFNDRLNTDVTYYTNKETNVILPLTIEPSMGAQNQIVNAGVIGNKGLEVAVNVIPVATNNLKWQTGINFSFNRTKVYSLAPGTPEQDLYNSEVNTMKVTVKPGDELGNIYVCPIATDNKGNKQIDDQGYYIIDQTRYVKAGNLLPKIVGGISNTLTYKRFSLTTMLDYRLGGQIISLPLKYGTSAGLYTSTLKYRDAQHGGLAYYIDGQGNYEPLPSTKSAGPNGEEVYHNGLILPGVTANGKANTTIIDAASYYIYSFAAGYQNSLNEGSAIVNNSYIKLREVTLAYKCPNKFAKSIGMSGISFSLIARNVFYVWRTLKNLDPETTVGSQWLNQGIDNGSVPANRSYGFSVNAVF